MKKKNFKTNNENIDRTEFSLMINFLRFMDSRTEH
jgi:hypothetical protein